MTYARLDCHAWICEASNDRDAFPAALELVIRGHRRRICRKVRTLENAFLHWMMKSNTRALALRSCKVSLYGIHAARKIASRLGFQPPKADEQAVLKI